MRNRQGCVLWMLGATTAACSAKRSRYATGKPAVGGLLRATNGSSDRFGVTDSLGEVSGVATL